MTRILTIIALLFATPMLAACTIGPTKSDISESGRLIYSAKVENFDIPKFFDCLRYRGGNLKLKAGFLRGIDQNTYVSFSEEWGEHVIGDGTAPLVVVKANHFTVTVKAAGKMYIGLGETLAEDTAAVSKYCVSNN